MRHISNIKTLFFIILTLYISISYGQNMVLTGGGMVIEDGTFLVVQGNIELKTEVSDGKIDLNGTILLDGNIENNTQDQVFINQEPTPNGWVVMPNTSIIQRIQGITPIAFENISLSGGEKILENHNSSANGILRLNATYNLNKRNFILNNKEFSALEHLGGYLYAETTPIEGIGSFQWNICSNIATYTIPFGTGNTNISDIPVVFETTNGGSANGGILFSTYPTIYTNTPYPDFVTTLAPYQPLQTADRFWIIDGDSYSTKPASNLTFSYTQSDVENGNNITENLLKPIMFIPSSDVWVEFNNYSADISNNKVTLQNISPSSLAKNWTLSNEIITGEIFFPNAFTPDTDGKNETFKPILGFIPKMYILTIYNRWGELLFSTTDPAKGWNGTFKSKDCQIASYVWKTLLIKPDGKECKYTGTVSLIK